MQEKASPAKPPPGQEGKKTGKKGNELLALSWGEVFPAGLGLLEQGGKPLAEAWSNGIFLL